VLRDQLVQHHPAASWASGAADFQALDAARQIALGHYLPHGAPRLSQQSPGSANLGETLVSTVGLAVTGEASGYVTRTLALQHLKAARYFARKAAEIECVAGNKEFGPWFEIFGSYFVGSVILACSSLEALYSETVHACNLHQSLPEAQHRSILDNFRSLNKSFPGSVVLGRAPGQHLSAILELRHVMVHPEPGSDKDPGKHAEAVSNIRNAWKEQAASPFFANERTIYHLYTHKCSDWIVTTISDFAIEVLMGTGQPEKKLAHFRAL
jgi:hypothetical protein